MKRSGEPKRSTWLPRRRAKKRRTSARRCPEYKRFVRTLPCSFRQMVVIRTMEPVDLSIQITCYGRIQAHHAGPRGLGQLADDFTCIPVCKRHHAQWHAASGLFKDTPKYFRVQLALSALWQTRRALIDALTKLATGGWSIDDVIAAAKSTGDVLSPAEIKALGDGR